MGEASHSFSPIERRRGILCPQLLSAGVWEGRARGAGQSPLSPIYAVSTPAYSFYFLERREGREKERERNIDVREKHRLFASRTPPAKHLV